MQLKRYTDYSLRVLIYLATKPDQVISINEIAEAYDISRNHLLKVVNGLVEQRLVRTFRGKTGGLQLARPINRINVGDVVRFMEGDHQIIDCHEPYCPILPACNLKRVLHEANQAFYKSLKAYTLEDLIAGKQGKLIQLLTG
ncbi:MAG: Rrf2 family transcriptional regulator [Thioalkalispiraceae bacterium]|jgi:Rrf2 family nitric oxide-sensitive transcriptional repressor